MTDPIADAPHPFAARARDLLRSLLDAALATALPERAVPAALAGLTLPAQGRILVLGAGKAAAAMAQAVERALPEADLHGLVITKDRHSLPTKRIRVLEASHPVPNQAGVDATRALMDAAREAGRGDTVLFLLSGGASALLSQPAAGLTLAEKQDVTRALLRAGATIHEMNVVRRALSAVKGGRLAAAIAPARLITLAISDVAGDDPAAIGSGPTAPDPSQPGDAAAILSRYGIAVGDNVRRRLDSLAAVGPRADDPAFANSDYRLIATPAMALEAAAGLAEENGLAVVDLGDRLEGEARALGAEHAALAKRVRDAAETRKPCVILSGGEATVTVRGNGRGGPNTEYLAGLAIALDGAAGIAALAADTDGQDGTEDNAGAMIFPDTLERAGRLGLSFPDRLDANDAYTLFEALGDLVKTGPTQTNVNDFRAILIT